MAKKATFILDENLLLQAKKVVEEGRFKSLNNFVETAVKEELARIKKEKIRQALIAASQDPLFLEDIRDVQNDFQSADFEEVEK